MYGAIGAIMTDLSLGSRVRKRGFNFLGTVIRGQCGPRGTWVAIKWDDGYLAKFRPKWCDKAELEAARIS